MGGALLLDHGGLTALNSLNLVAAGISPTGPLTNFCAADSYSVVCRVALSNLWHVLATIGNQRAVTISASAWQS